MGKYWQWSIESKQKITGRPSNAKGKHWKLSDENKKNISKALTGRIFSKEHCENIKLNHVGTKGTHQTEETKEKVRLAKQNMSKESRNNYRLANLGDKNPNFGKRKTAEIKEKRNATLAKHVAEGLIKPYFMNTKPELMVFNDYTNRGYKEGVDIIKQYYAKGVGSADFYLPKENKLIFVDGDFWHCNPNHPIFGNPDYFHPVLKKHSYEIWKRDMDITNKAITLGYKVRRIWQSVV